MSDPSTPADNQQPSQSEPGPDRMRALLVASGLSLAEAASALDVDEPTLLRWCQPGGKILPPRSAIEMLSRLVAMRRKAKL